MSGHSELVSASLQAPSDALSYAIVRSGTSRVVVLRGDQLPAASAARERIILRLLTHELAEEGIGRDHYQSNKVAVLGPGDDIHPFSFHFYQGVPQSRRLFSRMECSNAASAAAVAAGLFGIITPESGSCFRSANLATHQHVELTPRTNWKDGNWGVRFTRLHHLRANFTEHNSAFCIKHRDMTIAGDIVRHGNIFVMAEVEPAQVDPDLVQKLDALGADFANRCGHPEAQSKLLVYRAGTWDGLSMDCQVACYSEGQRHRSFPGSAAMAMSAFFSIRNLVHLPEGRDAETHLHLSHPSGTMTAHSQLHRSRHWEVVSTSFETPVQVIEHGTVQLPSNQVVGDHDVNHKGDRYVRDCRAL